MIKRRPVGTAGRKFGHNLHCAAARSKLPYSKEPTTLLPGDLAELRIPLVFHPLSLSSSLGIKLNGASSHLRLSCNGSRRRHGRRVRGRGRFRDHTTTPIKHLVVIFQENVSFDYYFGTYPGAQKLTGETPFKASKHTPRSINTLLTPLDVTNYFAPLAGVDLINKNPNGPLGTGAAINEADASNPFRLAPSRAASAPRALVRHR
jgi:hypothetical protein